MGKYGNAEELKNALKGVEQRKAWGQPLGLELRGIIRATNVGLNFFKAVKQKSFASIIIKFQDNHGRVITKKVYLGLIYHNFYAQLYSQKDVNVDAMREIFEGFMPTFNEVMNEIPTQEITEEEFGMIAKEMAKGEAPECNRIPAEFFQQLLPIIREDFYRMILEGVE